MKRIIIKWKSKNRDVMGAKVQDEIADKLKQIEDNLNEETPQDPTKILSEFIEKDNLDFFNPVDVETSEYKIQIMED